MRQLKQRYTTLAVDNILSVYVLPVQQQCNDFDCGCHAIATAVEFREDGNPCATFDLEKMRSHLITCFDFESFEPFPKSMKKAWASS